MNLRTALRGGTAAFLMLAATACESNSTGPDQELVEGEITLNGSAGWAYADLDAANPLVTVANPSTDSNWDIAVNATSVMLNGGAAGPGGVVGYCICANESATDAQVMAFTAQGELADFTSVTSAAIPTDSTKWARESLTPVVTGWWSYNSSSHVVSADPSKVFYVRTAEGTAWAKLHVTALTGATQAHAGTVTVEYALQTATNGPFGATKTATVNVANGKQYFDLTTGTVSSAATDWDLAFEGYAIKVNGGASGSGQAGAVAAGTTFELATNASAVPAATFRGDTYAGVFAAHPWYRYNLDGTSHQIYPVFNVYLLKRGSTVYKVQITSYYGPAGETRRITLRYAQLEG